MSKLASFYVLIFTISLSCTRTVFPSNEGIHLAIDSLYIDEIETGSTLEQLPAIYYFCSVKNKNNSPINLPIAKYPGDNLEDKCFLLINDDTIKMNLDAQPLITIRANDEQRFWLKTNTFDLIDFMEKTNKKSESELQLLKKLIRKSILMIDQNDRVIKARPATNIRIKYRDRSDKTIN